MLVNIYGSKDLFVSEYRTLLADRILSLFNYDVDREVGMACYPYRVLNENTHNIKGTVCFYSRPQSL